MGLDCNVLARDKNATEEAESTELWYGRKTNEIHGWMEQQWRLLNPEKADEVFNCEDLTLTPELLDALEAAAANKTLEATSGFYFGGANGDEEVAADVQELVGSARKAISDGLHVFYTSWW